MFKSFRQKRKTSVSESSSKSNLKIKLITGNYGNYVHTGQHVLCLVECMIVI